MSIDVMKQALDALEDPWKAGPEGVAEAITALRAAIEQAPVQMSALEFVEMVYEKEHLVGKPIAWAQWPTEENT